MRKLLITIFLCIFGLTFVKAQRFGYIDTDYILKKMPEYAKAEEEINQLSQAWEKEAQEMMKGIEGMYAALQAEQVLLTDEMKTERTEAIKKKEGELKEYQKKVFVDSCRRVYLTCELILYQMEVESAAQLNAMLLVAFA